MERKLVISAKTYEVVPDGTVACFLLGDVKGKELLHSIGGSKRIVLVVATYAFLMVASTAFYVSNDAIPGNHVHIFHLSLSFMIGYDVLLVYHIVPLFQTSILKKILQDFTTLYLIFQILICQTTYGILVFQDPLSTPTTNFLTVGVNCIHGISEIVRIFADAFPPDLQQFKLCVYFVSFLQYLIFASVVSSWPSLFMPSHEMQEVTLHVGGKGWLASDLLSGALWTLAIFFGKLLYYCWSSPGACGILMEQLKIEFIDEMEELKKDINELDDVEPQGGPQLPLN